MPLEDFFFKEESAMQISCRQQAAIKISPTCVQACVYDAPPHIEEHYLYELTGKEPV